MARPKKPGYRTSEFWLSLVALVLGALIASGAIGEESGTGQLIAFAASTLTALGYSLSRGMVKKAEALTDALEEDEEDPE